MAELYTTSLFSHANLKYYYRLSDANDSKGSRNLTNNNSVGFVTGKFGNCADFGSANTNKSLSYNAVMVMGGQFTYVAWVKLQSEVNSGEWTFLSDSKINVSPYWFGGIDYEYNAGTRRLAYWIDRNGVASHRIYKTATLGTSDWHHLALTYDGTNMKAYHNGSLIDTVAVSGNGSSCCASDFRIGCKTWGTGTGNYASALIEDVALFDAALALSDIQTLYNEAAASFVPKIIII